MAHGEHVTGPRVVAIVQHKGGSGKTTTVVNLAAALAESGARVLLIDLDAQGTATAWAGLEPSGELAAVYLEGATLAVTALRQAVAALPSRWDWVILDTPPAAGIVALSTMLAAAWAVVPVEASSVALAGVPSVLAALEDARAAVAPSPGPRLAGVLLTRHDSRTRAAAAVSDALRDALGADMFTATIRETVRHREAAALGLSILAHDPTGAGSADYRAAARELTERTNHAESR